MIKFTVTPLSQVKVSQPTTQKIDASALHVDTIKISHAYRNYDLPPPDELKNKGFELITRCRKNSNDIITAHIKPNNSIRYHLTVIKNEFGYCGVNIEFSLAKYFDRSGLGIQTDADVDSAFDDIESIIYQLVGAKFDRRTAKVSRLDVNADFPVGEDKITSYINAISRPSLRFTPAAFGDTTIQFHNKSRKLMVYGKYKEVEKRFKKGKATTNDLEAAKGLLRVEIGLRKTPLDRLAKKLNVSAEASQLINLSVANHVVSSGLQELRLDMPKISHDKLYRLMSEHFGKAAPLMLGIVQYHAVYGDDFWKILGWSQAKYYKKKKELEDANLWNVSHDEELPALGLPHGL
jgi:hypothetical protein